MYEEAYCDLRLDGNRDQERVVLETVAKQLNYDKGLATFMLEEGQLLSCGGIKEYVEESGLPVIKLHTDIRRACSAENEDEFPYFLAPPPENETKEEKKEREEKEAQLKLSGSSRSPKDLARLKERLEIAYLKEYQLQSHKMRLEKTFESSERYWDGQLEASTPFDIMVDLNVMDTLLFGSQAQWVNDVYGFSKNQDVEENDPDPVFQNLNNNQNNAQQNQQNNQQIQQNNQEPISLSDDFIHPDCFNQTTQKDPLCGNGVIDLLTGEECDDGNNQEGDGCNNSCEISFGTLQCKDPFAVNLQAFGEIPSEGNSKPFCPPNLNVQSNASQSPQANNTNENQGGDDAENPIFETPPFVGGTLTPLPVSENPACPAGQSLAKLTALGGGEGKEVSKCIPTNFCGDFNAIRTALFGEGWEESENADIAASIETAVCVNFTTLNRPNSPYPTNEGCIDCHFRAMADSLEEALSSNVTPLANTTGAFALSDRWGPNFSLDLNIAVQKTAKLDLQTPATQPSAKNAEKEEEKGELDDAIDAADQTSRSGQSSLPDQTTPTQVLNTEIDDLNNRLDAVSESLQVHQVMANTTTDFAFSNQVVPQINALSQSFGSIQVALMSMLQSTEDLSTKPICKP